MTQTTFPTLFPTLLLLRLVARHGLSRRRLPNALALPLKWALTWPFRVLDRLLYADAVRTARIERPVFVVGHFRSGTTWLQRLLSKVAPFATPTVFQVLLSEGFLTAEPLLKGLLQRVTTALDLQNDIDGTPLDWDYPGEEDVALFMAPFPASANWAMVFPRDRAAILDRTLAFPQAEPARERAFFEGWFWFVRKVQARYPGARLLLKNPPNTCRMEALAQHFPDARFIYLHRHPAELFASLRRFWAFVSRRALHELDDDEIDAAIVESIRSYHEAFLRSRERLAPASLVVVRYEDLEQEPVAELAALWECLDTGLPFPKDAMEALVARNGKKGKRPLTVTDELRAKVARDLPSVLAFWESCAPFRRPGVRS